MHGYEQDLNAWAHEQARLLRAGHFESLDVEHVAEEIEAMGRRQQRQLADDLAALLAHLLKWKFQPERRGASWEKTIRAQRKEIGYTLDQSPSLRAKLQEPRWVDMVWARAVAQAVNETGLDCFPEQCPWIVEDEILAEDWRAE
jgi:hypothetical protein